MLPGSTRVELRLWPGVDESMVETIGRKLSKARKERGISIEEAAHATRVRHEKLAALEADDYGSFGSNAYAKGFLQIYGRYLGVDVSDHVAALESSKQVSISDYQYLNNAVIPEPKKIAIRRSSTKLSLVPLLLLPLAGLIALMSFWFNVNAKRLGLDKPPETVAPVQPGAQKTGDGTMIPSPSTDAKADNVAVAEIPVLEVPEVSISAPSMRLEVARPEAQAVPEAPAVNTPAPVAEGPQGSQNEIVVEPLKKTWVKVRREGPTAEPVFEDYLYPGDGPLKLKGGRFFVEVRDQDAVQIRKNGHPIAYRAPGISIQ